MGLQIKAGVLVALALAATAPAAHAQAAREWRAAEGRFVVTIPEGWAEVEDEQAPPGSVLIIGSRAMRDHPDRWFRECVVGQTVMKDMPRVSQDEANARMEGAPGGGRGPENVIDAAREGIEDGVRVRRTTWRSGPGLWMSEAAFVRATGGSPVLYTLACGANGGDALGEDVAASLRFLGSLRFSR